MIVVEWIPAGSMREWQGGGACGNDKLGSVREWQVGERAGM